MTSYFVTLPFYPTDAIEKVHTQIPTYILVIPTEAKQNYPQRNNNPPPTYSRPPNNGKQISPNCPPPNCVTNTLEATSPVPEPTRLKSSRIFEQRLCTETFLSPNFPSNILHSDSVIIPDDIEGVVTLPPPAAIFPDPVSFSNGGDAHIPNSCLVDDEETIPASTMSASDSRSS